MVSLINFKIVNEELRADQQQQQFISETNYNAVNNQMFVNVAQPQDSSDRQQMKTNNSIQMTTTNSRTNQANDNKPQNLQLTSNQQQSINQTEKFSSKATTKFNQNSPPNRQHQPPFGPDLPLPPASNQHPQQVQPTSGSEAPDFVVTWRNLSFMIEPKWHQKMVNASLVGARTSAKPASDQNNPTRTSATATSVQQYHSNSNVPQSTVQNKIVLDRLDGSFKSGELTAILGPSGKCSFFFFSACYFSLSHHDEIERNSIKLYGHVKHF